MQVRTLRGQISILLVVLVTVGITVAGIAATASLRTFLISRIDEQISRSGGQMRAMGQVVPLGPGQGRPQAPGRYYVATLDPAGRVTAVLSDPDAESGDAPVVDLAVVGVDTPTTVPGTVRDTTWRVLVERRSEDSGYVLVGSSLAEVNATLRQQVTRTVTAGVVVAALAGALGFALVRRRMRPLSEMARTTEWIAAGDLAQRVPTSQGSAEVDHLAMAFNEMVDRIERAFAAQQDSEAQSREREAAMRRFVADAGHELRTPLTTIRGFAELVRDGEVEGPERIGDALGRIEDEATRMGVLVEDLLLLARLDERRPMEAGTVVVADLVARAHARVTALEPGHPCTFEADEQAAAAVVRGDSIRLMQLIDNLVTNAVRHTPDGTPIDLTVSVVGRQLRVVVADHGPGIAVEDAERVFERFTRLDPTRSRATGGTGLGLAIAREIALAHGGTLVVDASPGEGARFVLDLPLIDSWTSIPVPAAAACTRAWPC